VVDALAIRTRAPRALVILAVYGILALPIGLIGYVALPRVVREVHTLSHDAPRYAAELRRNPTFRHYDDRYHLTAKLLKDTHQLPELLGRAAGPLKDVTVGAASFLAQLITVLAVTFLLVLHGREYSELGLSLTGRRQQRYRQVIIGTKDRTPWRSVSWWASSTSYRWSARPSGRSSRRWPPLCELPDRGDRLDRVHHRLAAVRGLRRATAGLRAP
jgi:AI-2E family transporter